MGLRPGYRMSYRLDHSLSNFMGVGLFGPEGRWDSCHVHPIDAAVPGASNTNHALAMLQCKAFEKYMSWSYTLFNSGKLISTGQIVALLDLKTSIINHIAVTGLLKWQCSGEYEHFVFNFEISL
jgi:hypothetical protein